MHQKITSLLAAVLAVLLLCSCGGQPSQQPNLPETPEEAPYAFTLDYHRCAPLVERQIGSDLAAAARLVVDAFLAGETSVTLPEGDYSGNPGNDLGYALNSMCPVFGAVTDYDDNHFDKAARTVTWAYTQTPEQIQEALAALEQTTAAYMSVLRQGDGETARALLLYHALTEPAAYDYEMEHGDGDSTEYQFRTSSYAALVLHSGICYSFAQALAFLYTQAGLDCAGARIAGDRDSAVAADNGTALQDREEIKYVALTFDDGPSPRCTPQLLDGLKERGVRATFFVVGCQVVKDPDIVIRMAAEGHQVGNHSYDHKELDKLSCGEAAEDMQRNNDLLCQLLGEGDYWVRPPYGLLSQEEMAALTVPIINWSVDTEDWKSKDAEKILDIIYRDAGDGDIILLHDRYLNSVDAALRAVDHLQQQGYRFVTVAELLALKGVEPEGGEVYRSVS